jgi:hypothetical protein
MILSVGQLHSAKQLLDWVAKNHLAKSDMNLFSRVLVCPAVDVLNLSTRCGWVEINLDGLLQLSDRGMQLHKIENYQVRLRLQMQDIISREQPSWSRLFPKGRQETANFVDSDVRQCLDEAALLSRPPSDEVVAWWDEMAGLVRGIKTSVLSQTGREGERRTLKYEHLRTGKEPTWQSIESNVSGYDVLSCFSESDETPLQIEVKSSENSLDYAELHITSNEWESATLARNYLFHLWELSPTPKLAIVTVEQMETHIPVNVGEGNWETVQIPYRVFRENFALVTECPLLARTRRSHILI